MMNSRSIVSPGTTGESLVSHTVPPPSFRSLFQPPMPVPISSRVPSGQVPTGEPMGGKQTSKKALLTETGLLLASKAMFLSAGIVGSVEVRSDTKKTLNSLQRNSGNSAEYNLKLYENDLAFVGTRMRTLRFTESNAS